MPRAPHEYLFKRRPFMERTVRDDVMALIASLVGVTAGYLLIGDDQPSVFVVVVGVGVLMIAVQGVVRHVIRERRDAASRMLPPD